MMFLSSVIKSSTVVDKRDLNALPPPQDAALFDHTVIKRGYVPMLSSSSHRIPSRDAYLDELNRLQIDIDEMEMEKEEVLRQKEELEAEITVLEEERDRLRQYEGLNIEEEVLGKIKAAEQEAENIRTVAAENAKRDSEALVDSLKAQAYLDGLEQGANEARQQVRDENKAGIEAIGQLIETLTGAKDKIVAESEGEIVELILSVAEKVIGKHLAEDPKAVADMLREAMEQNRREDYVKVILSKDLMPVQAKAADSVRKLIESLGQQVNVFVDPDADPKSLIVESPGGFTDLSVDTQLDNIRETMKDSETEAPEETEEAPEAKPARRTRKPKAAKAPEEEV